MGGAIEEYAGKLRAPALLPPRKGFSSTRSGAVDRSSKVLSIETGVGFGVTAGADMTFKLMLSRDLN